MARKKYLRPLDEANRIRVMFETQRGRVIKFATQYEAMIGSDWRAIVRYDTAHGYFHQDILSPDGTQKKKIINMGDFGSALSYAQEDLLKNWEFYKESYLEKMKK